MRTSDTLSRSSGRLLRCSWPGEPSYFGVPNTERRATSLQSSSFSMVTGCALICLSPSVAYALYFRQRPVREPRGGISDLAFPDGPLVDAAKLGILAASLIAGAIGWAILRGSILPTLIETR